MNRIIALFNVKYPIVQAGMIWCSGWKLASAVSNSGGLGIIGSGSMYPEILVEHVKKCKQATKKPFAVNLPLLYPDIDKHIETIIKYKVPIVFTSAGSPKKWTKRLKDHGIIVVHVVSSLTFALKSQEAGVDAVVAEGFEAGGHNGKDETTSMCLIPQVCKHLDVPVIAAGGIGDGNAMLSAMILGADGVQMGTRFVVSKESSAHALFKKKVIETKEGDTILTLKELTPVRLIKNQFFSNIEKAYENSENISFLKELLGKGRAKKGMFEGDLIEGELEIGQISSLMSEILPASEIVSQIIQEYNTAKLNLNSEKFNF